MNNEQRIDVARFAVASACFARGESPYYGEESLTDLLADLRHYCAAHDIDYEHCAHFAAMHFNYESAEDSL